MSGFNDLLTEHLKQLENQCHNSYNNNKKTKIIPNHEKGQKDYYTTIHITQYTNTLSNSACVNIVFSVFFFMYCIRP